jgi:phage shock protein C
MLMNRRLYRCRDNRMVAGVASGIAEYFGLDPSLVRILWLVSIFFGGFSILLYIAMAFIVPLEPMTPEAAAAHAAAEAAGSPNVHRHRAGPSRVVTFIGVVLLLIGGLALVDAIAPGWATWRQLWPLLFIGAGGFLLFTSMRREVEEPPSTAGLAGGPPATES